jgi:5-hydroxyisourate hydrolase
MGRLTTHVLDTARGLPAAGMRIDVEKLPGSATPLKRAVTNANGRTDAPLLEGSELTAGTWRIVFHAGDYFRARGDRDAGRFLEDVPVVFVVDDPSAAYHVPLLVSPWSYSTYRGS